MHDLPRQKLSELLNKHGHSLCDDAKKLEGLLKDVLRNEHKRETFVLISSLREGVAHELRGSRSGMPPAALAVKLTRQLCDNLALDEAAARWSVESWAIALGVEITQPKVAPTKQVTRMKATGPLPMPPGRPAPSVGVDLAAIAMQHREKARQDQVKAEQDRVKAAQAEALAMQMQREADLLAAQMEKEAKANAVPVQKEAKRLAEQTRDFAAAARMLEEIDPQWRDAKLYESICGYRDKVTTLDTAIQDAVHKGRLRFLRGRVQELFKLQPKRDDMRRLLEVLPDEPELPLEFTNSIGMRFVLIEPGEFMMGSNEADHEKPPHLVEITQPFYLGVYPVTQAEYKAVMGMNPSHFNGNARLPVEQVNWIDSLTFCEKLNRLTVEVQRKAHYRLPTEAEWEYACRAGSTGKWCTGDDVSSLYGHAWLYKNSDSRTHPVGEKKANNWGLHDMHGNVWEWCADYYGNYSLAMLTDLQGPTTGSSRVGRGGSWACSPVRSRSAYRSNNDPLNRSDFLGFRLALSIRITEPPAPSIKPVASPPGIFSNPRQLPPTPAVPIKSVASVDTTGTYEERLPCGGKLKVTKVSWEIAYYFPGPDRRYNGTFVSIPGASIQKYIDAYLENWSEYEQLKASIPSGGEFSKDGEMGMSIRLGRVMAGVCLRSYHMPIDSQTRLEHILDGYRYAVNRAPEIQKLLASE